MKCTATCMSRPSRSCPVSPPPCFAAVTTVSTPHPYLPLRVAHPFQPSWAQWPRKCLRPRSTSKVSEGRQQSKGAAILPTLSTSLATYSTSQPRESRSRSSCCKRENPADDRSTDGAAARHYLRAHVRTAAIRIDALNCNKIDRVILWVPLRRATQLVYECCAALSQSSEHIARPRQFLVFQLTRSWHKLRSDIEHGTAATK